MDSRIRMEPGTAAEQGNDTEGGLDFVRFCYRRRHVGWPELYDEMCAVAGRGLYRGWGFMELAERGIGFGLWEMPRLAALVGRVVEEENERRTRILANVMARMPGEPQEAPEPLTTLVAAGVH